MKGALRNIHYKMVLILWGMGHLICAVAHDADSLKTLASLPGADMALYRLYDEMQGKNPEEAMVYAHLFLEKLDTTVAHPISARMANILADYYEKEVFQYSDAITWRFRALNQYTALQDDFYTAVTQYNLARIYYRTRQYHKTLQLLNEAITLLTPMGQIPMLAECYNLLGATHYVCQDYANAKRYFEQYAEETMSRKDSSRIPIALNNIAIYAQYQGDTTRSRKLIETAISICKDQHNEEILIRSYLNLASNFIESQNISSAQYYLDLAAPHVNDIEMKGLYHLNTSLVHQHREEWEESIDALNKAIEQYQQGEFQMNLRNCYDQLIEIYLKIGNLEKSHQTALAYYKLSKEMQLESSFLQLFQYQNEIIQKNEAEQLLKQRISQRYTIIILVVTMLLCLSLVLIYLWRRSDVLRKREAALQEERLSNEKNQQEILAKNQILEVKKMERYRFDRLRFDMIKQLNAIKPFIKEKEVRDKLNQICHELGSKDEELWQEVSQYLPEFNSEFFQKLIRDFPTLSVNERRLCAFLHLNLSTKEIADITRQTPHSINIARYRLRQKLGIKNSDISLQEFLHKYD